jgi:hypothetical protein
MRFPPSEYALSAGYCFRSRITDFSTGDEPALAKMVVAFKPVAAAISVGPHRLVAMAAAGRND